MLRCTEGPVNRLISGASPQPPTACPPQIFYEPASLPGTVGTSFTFPPADLTTEKGNCHTFSPPEGGGSSDGALSRLHHRRTMVPDCPITSPRWPRRPFTWTKVPCEREKAIPKRSASTGGQVFKGGGSEAADGEQHTDRAARAEGRRERYRWPPDHQPRRSECYRPTLVDELQSEIISQHTACRFHDWWRD